MKEVTIKLYEFDELSERAQEEAIEKLSDINVDYDWWKYVYEDAERIGLKINEFDLEREYDYLTSGEAIIETIRANEYYFTEDGTLY